MVSEKILKYKENFGIFLVILSLYLFRTYKYLFPDNYQQDDVSELEVTFDSLYCAVNELGDNHPFLSTIIWISSKLFSSPEYIVSGLIIFVTVLSFQLVFNTIKRTLLIKCCDCCFNNYYIFSCNNKLLNFIKTIQF